MERLRSPVPSLRASEVAACLPPPTVLLRHPRLNMALLLEEVTADHSAPHLVLRLEADLSALAVVALVEDLLNRTVLQPQRLRLNTAHLLSVRPLALLVDRRLRMEPLLQLHLPSTEHLRPEVLETLCRFLVA